MWIFFNWIVFSLVLLSVVKITGGKENLNSKKLNYVNTRIQNIRVIKGTNFDYFSGEGKKIFFEKEFTISRLTDRMGMRLEGSKIENKINTNIKSEGLIKGVIQVPADGNPVVLSTVTAVPDPPVPAVSALSDPSNSVLCDPVTLPP